jgi:hypothetical protein
MILRKNIIAVGLLLLVVAPICIFTTLFVFQKIAQHNMEEKLEKVSLQTIKLSISDFTWIKKNKEIKIGNEMFDVKSFIKKGDKIVFTGLYDKTEKQINNQIKLLVNNKNTDQQSSGLLILKIGQTACLLSTSFALEPCLIYHTKKSYPFYNEKMLALANTINTPPPIL